MQECRHRVPAIVMLSAAAAAGCGEPIAGGTGVTVAFVYSAQTAPDPQVAAQYSVCVQGVNQTHVHASWLDYQAVVLTPKPPDRWTVTYQDVPFGVEHRIRLNDPNNCDQNATGATTTGITANGVSLTKVVDTPGSGTEPGLAFRVDASGVVTP